jgi:hypothetical protein
MQSRFVSLFFIFLLWTAAESCSTTRIVTKYDCNTVDNNRVNTKTSWTFLWGLIQPKDIDPKCESAYNHLNKVEVKTNIGFILISAVTLGGIIPQRLEWCCAPQNLNTDTLGTDSTRRRP